MMDKDKIYVQIRNFNNAPSNPNVGNSSLMADAYLYVKDAIAIDNGQFLAFLKQNRPEFKDKKWSDLTILDMAFGSGNLTSRLVLENFTDVKTIQFNDKNDEANTKIVKVYPEGKSRLSKHDFLNKEEWTEAERADVVIFNPQINGSYTKGNAGFEKITPVISDVTIGEYLAKRGADLEKLEIEEDPINRKIVIKSEELTKTQLMAMLKDVKIFNYSDVFYQSKYSKEEGVSTNLVKFRATFDKIFSDDGLVIFLDSQDYFKYLFADFNHIFNFWVGGTEKGQHLFVAQKMEAPLSICYEKIDNAFVEIPDCKKANTANDIDGDLDSLEDGINDLLQQLNAAHDTDSLFSTPDDENADEDFEEETLENAPKTLEKESKTPFILRGSELGNPDFPYKNILLKGVPGTGKSWRINKIIEDKLGLGKATHDNVLRINVHSASSNADLMQGIGIATKDKNIEYHEKKGLILQHLERAIAAPYEAFVIVLEEIQENSLNELIGDLIYLIEDEKRADIQAAMKRLGDTFDGFDAFLDQLAPTYFVKVPYLVSTETRYRRLIVPKNLYFFCTSNYRDDKKIVEDNLLRRFDLIEIYPEYTVVKAPEVATFLKALNDSILRHFDKNETHPDRFMIGHAAWMHVHTPEAFCRALLKAITEFKDIREIEFKDTEKILKPLTDLPFGLNAADILRGSYKTIIEALQQRGYKDLF